MNIDEMVGIIRIRKAQNSRRKTFSFILNEGYTVDISRCNNDWLLWVYKWGSPTLRPIIVKYLGIKRLTDGKVRGMAQRILTTINEYK